jgi:hypothetical protein
LKVDWSGTNSDRVIIGCYKGDGDFSCGSLPYNDSNRAVIDGNNNSYPETHQGLVDIHDQSFITVKDLKLQYAGQAKASTRAISAVDSDNIDIENCYIYRCRTAICYMRVDTGTVTQNYCGEIGYPDWEGTGAAVEFTAANVLGSTTNITVSHNIVVNSKHEGIGFYKGVTESVMEYNVVRDVRSALFYIASSPNNTMRYNLAYESSDRINSSFDEDRLGFVLDIEAWRDRYAFSVENTKIYGNFAAGMKAGISIGCSEKFDGDQYDTKCADGTLIFNNTLVDNKENIKIWNSASDVSIAIKNNISLTTVAGTNHVSPVSPAGVTFSHNLFDEKVSGNAATNQIVGDPQLNKTSGWRNLEPDSLSGEEFLPKSIIFDQNKGTAISGYNDFIASCNFKSSPIDIVINKVDDSFMPIGALIKNDGIDYDDYTSDASPSAPSGISVHPIN